MRDEQTCGKGLAEHSTVPVTLGKLMGAVADVLEIHTGAIDLGDENGQRERRAYLRLVGRHREAAELLRATGDEMAGYRDLPMAGHDVGLLASDAAVDAFAGVVATEEELLGLLQRRLEEDRAMLGLMRAG